MPLTGTRWVLIGPAPLRLQCRQSRPRWPLDGAPELAVHRDVALALGPYLDDAQAALAEGVAQCWR